MMAYLGGDTNTLAARRAKNNDIRMAVEYPDHDRMLTVCVMQTGEVLVSWSKVRSNEPSEYLEVVGKVFDNHGELGYFPAFEDTAFAHVTKEPVVYDHSILRVVHDDSPEDEEEEGS